MVIGIIGASISGLIAGKRLAGMGHDVTVIERNRSLGGRLTTVNLDDLKLDVGLSHFSATTGTFKAFIDEMVADGVLREWAEEFSLYDGQEVFEIDPSAAPQKKYAAPGGMQSVAEKLSRWVDLKPREKAGGLTYIGPDRTKKRSWMINLTDINVFECDAVIIATPAPEAYGILQTVQNVTATRRIIRHIDEVQYNGCMALAATYDHEAPGWKGIECEHSAIRWIGNETTKQETGKTGLIIQSTPEFYRKHARLDDKKIRELLLDEAAGILDSRVLQPKSTYLHRWKYFESVNPINEYFMELEMDEAPLALIGDYFGGSSVENAYISGYNLAEYWIKKYSEVIA